MTLESQINEIHLREASTTDISVMAVHHRKMFEEIWERKNQHLESVADVLVEDFLKTSAIEGKKLEPDAVRSSVGCRLGIKAAGLTYVQDQKADGLVQILLDATGNYSRKLSSERLFAWHAELFPTGYSGMVHIDVARWRDDKHGPMQVQMALKAD